MKRENIPTTRGNISEDSINAKIPEVEGCPLAITASSSLKGDDKDHISVFHSKRKGGASGVLGIHWALG